MKNIYLNIYKANLINLKKAKKILKNNNLIGMPTETVYGLAGNAYSNKAVKKIFKLKKRPFFNPLIVHYQNIKALKNDVDYDNSFKKLYKTLCPGPITFILNKKKNSKISRITTANKETVAVRFPSHKVAKKLLRVLNFPLAAPSANISSMLSPTCANDVNEEFSSELKLILDGGECNIGLESTIIDLTHKPIILRQGSISEKKISKVLGKKVIYKKKSRFIKSPGQLNFHYSPGIPVLINKITL